MRPREIETLRMLAAGPGTLASLLTRFPRSTAYRIVRRLVARGYLARDGERFVALEPARRFLASPPDAPSPGPPRLPFPHLALMPSPEHLALATLVVLARGARRRFERHHASFVLFSRRGLRGKTFFLRACSLILGAGEHRVLNAGAETRASLGARRNARGEVIAVREALQSPFVGIDEWRRGAAVIRRTVEVLMGGDREIPLEREERLRVESVVALATNSPEGATTLRDQTGLDEPMIRRSFATNLDGVVLDATFSTDGEDRLVRLRALGPVVLPEPRSPEFEAEARERVRAALQAVLADPERLGSLDLVLLGQLIVVATAVLSPTDAVALVAHCACVLYATLGWLQGGWNALLDAALAQAEAPAPLPEGAPVPAAVAATEPEVPNPFDWDARVAALDAVARGLTPEQVRDDLALAQGVRVLGIDRASLPTFERLVESAGSPEEATTALDAFARIDAAGLDVAEVVEHADVLRRLRIAPSRAGRLLGIVLALEEHGLAAEDVGYVADAFGRSRLRPPEGLAVVVDLLARWNGLPEALAALDLERREAQARADAARADSEGEIAWLVAFRAAAERARNPALGKLAHEADRAMGAEVARVVNEYIERRRQQTESERGVG
jgi:hypothetical protein